MFECVGGVERGRGVGLRGWVWGGDWGGFYPCLESGNERDRDTVNEKIRVRIIFQAVTLFVTLAVVVVALVSLLPLAQRACALVVALRP